MSILQLSSGGGPCAVLASLEGPVFSLRWVSAARGATSRYDLSIGT
jgi:hypothetical protein